MNFLHRHPRECAGLTLADLEEVEAAGVQMLEIQAKIGGQGAGAMMALLKAMAGRG